MEKLKNQNYMTNKEYIEFLNKVFEEVEKHCKKYNFRCGMSFNRIYIHTPFEEFYFVPRPDGIIKLMHKNGIFSNRYHLQFNKKISIPALVRYIDKHTKYRFKPAEPKAKKVR